MSTERLISLAAATVLDAEPAVAIDAAARAGFGALGLRWDTERHKGLSLGGFRRQLNDAGLILLDLEVIRLGPEAGMDSHRRVVDVAAELRPRWLLTVSHHTDADRTRDELLEIAQMLEPIECGISLEFMVFTELRTAGAALDMVASVRAAGAHNIGVLVDALHLDRSGGSPAGLPGAIAEHLSYVQLCDARTDSRPGVDDVQALAHEARHARLFPGEGDLPLSELLQAVPETTVISVEVQSREWADRANPADRAAHAMKTTLQIIERENERS